MSPENSQPVSSILENSVVPQTPDQLPPTVREQLLTPPEAITTNDKFNELPLAEPKHYKNVMNMFMGMFKPENEPASVLVAGTGAGKSSIGFYMLRELSNTMEQQASMAREVNSIKPPKKGPFNVPLLGSQPRRVATTQTAENIAEISKTTIGDKIGYQMRDDRKIGPNTDSMFITEGLFQRFWATDRLLRGIKILFADEIHEGNADTALELGMAKITNQERKKAGLPLLKIVATTATIDIPKVTGFLSTRVNRWGKKEPVPHYEVPGKAKNIERRFHKGEDVLSDNDVIKSGRYMEVAASKTVAAVEKIIRTPLSADRKTYGNAMIFMPGKEEADNTVTLVEQMLEQKYGPNFRSRFEVLTLYREQSKEKEKLIWTKNGKIKIIVSTDIGETSITPRDLEYVCDSTLVKRKVLDRKTGIESLELMKHAQSGLIQRGGRTGRTRDGEVDYLCSEEDFKNRLKFPIPEILRIHLGPIILRMKNLGIHNIDNFEFIDPPKVEDLRRDERDLMILGALDPEGRITEIGKTMEKIGQNPEYSRMIVEAKKQGCVADICIAIAAAGQDSLFMKKEKDPGELRTEMADAHKQFIDPRSDYQTAINIWNWFEASGFNLDLARANHLNVTALKGMMRTRTTLLRDLDRVSIPFENNYQFTPTMTPEERKEVMRNALGISITSGAVLNLMRQNKDKSFSRIYFQSTEEHADQIRIDRSSNVSVAGPSWKHYLSGKLVSIPQKDKEGKPKTEIYTGMNQDIDPKWIAKAADYLCERRIVDYTDRKTGEIVRRIVTVLRKTGDELATTDEHRFNSREAKIHARQFAEKMAREENSIPTPPSTQKNKGFINWINSILDKLPL